MTTGTTMRNLAFIIVTLTVLVDSRCLAQSLADRFDRADRNVDGKVTREETAGAPWFDRLLRRLDRNRNGVLERNEFAGTELRRRTGGISDLKSPEEPPLTKHLNIRYAEIEGVDPNLLSLDLYVPENVDASGRRPVMIMIHGGGWRRGDKANPPIVGAKMRHFVGNGYIYASINYRLAGIVRNIVPQHVIENSLHA